eukprot:Plantae.Rhodophyta-Purpureofilum_apyrenoidigerum.ctg18088.p1 GENE.Plantae.Rhodophyta-Purpureofilum_apyrenoidigerum.ctg18088~~Plantae.Rhodophyta-Purpureofilum_apyrenoidigerum.ctg18088.p1  ORF type:complete len:280 (-),score=26.90 Plantae.Rhodophyta-Purpureofilum_apyrenoidigerum.ctg18088:304-1143(-)
MKTSKAVVVLLTLCVAATISMTSATRMKSKYKRMQWCKSLTAMNRYEKANIKAVRSALSKIVYPLSKKVALESLTQGIVPPEWSPKVFGRVNPVGTFNDFPSSVEYFYGLANPVVGPDVNSRVTNITFQSVVAQGDQVTVRLSVEVTPFDSGVSRDLVIFGIYFMDKQSQIRAYDANLLNLQYFTGSVSTDAAPLCAVIQSLCTGENQQFPSTAKCVQYLSSIPVGTFDRASSNTFVCRIIHTKLIALRPAIHCPHVGPTGGGKCVDVPYEKFLALDLY